MPIKKKDKYIPVKKKITRSMRFRVDYVTVINRNRVDYVTGMCKNRADYVTLWRNKYVLQEYYQRISRMER